MLPDRLSFPFSTMHEVVPTVSARCLLTASYERKSENVHRKYSDCFFLNVVLRVCTFVARAVCTFAAINRSTRFDSAEAFNVGFERSCSSCFDCSAIFRM